MKKRYIVCLLLLVILALSLTGCGNTLNDKTVQKTRESWNEAANKESTDTIVVSDLKFSELINLKRAKITFTRKFEPDKTIIDFTVNEVNVIISNHGKTLITIALNILRDKLNNHSINYSEFESIINGFEKISGQIVLTNGNKNLHYNVLTQINYKPETYSKEVNGDITIDTSLGYGKAIDKAMQTLSEHLCYLFEPKKDGTAVFNKSNINVIIKAAVEYQATIDADIKKKLNKIFGCSYSEVLNSKIVINESTSSTKVKKDFITDMNISFSKIQFMYNKEQLANLLTELVTLLDPDSASQVGAIKMLLTELTKGESCIEVGNISINSVSKIG